MGGSLRDQMLKQGLVTKKQAKAAKHAETVAEAERRKAKADAASAEAAALEEARRALEEKAARDRAQNQEREAERAEAARLAEARDIIRKHKVRPEGKEVAYHFTDEAAVKTIHISRAQQKAIGRGLMAIVADGDGYALLSEESAEKLIDRAPELVLCFYDRADAEPADDPHRVPDDLMW